MDELKRFSPWNKLAFILKKKTDQRLTKEETRSKNITVPTKVGQGYKQYPSNKSPVVNISIVNRDYYFT